MTFARNVTEQAERNHMKPTFQGEVLMRRWSDSSTQGVQVTFALSDADELEPLKAKTGKRFMAVLVEIGDDEQPVQQPEDQAEKRREKWAQLGPRCKEAIDLAKNLRFQTYVGTRGLPATHDGAERAIKLAAGVESRTELDENEMAYSAFVKYLRTPFLAWVKREDQRTEA